MTDDEEIVVGVHESGIELYEGMNVSLSRNYCANCRRKTHSYVEVDRETGEAKLHITCTNKECACKCKTHYACKQCGYLHPYNQKCTHKYAEKNTSPESDAEFTKIMDAWRSTH